MTNETKITKIPFLWVEYEKFEGADLNLIYKEVKGDSNGVNITGFVKKVKGNSKGFDITGAYNCVEGNSKGVSLTGFVNYSKRVKDFLIQYATLKNEIKEIPENAIALQFGLFNKIGERYCPIVNIHGIKNISKLIKETFGKIKKNLEEKLRGEDY